MPKLRKCFFLPYRKSTPAFTAVLDLAAVYAKNPEAGDRVT